MNGSDAVPVIRYGRSRLLPEQRELRAGPVTMMLDDGTLRHIRIGDEVIIQQIYIAVRDRNWGTVEPVFERYEVDDRGDSFTIRLRAVTRNGEIDFVWEALIEGSEQGSIRFAMEGSAQSDMLTNRTGFCVLHPMEFAGKSVTVTTPEGTSMYGRFPEEISPHQPFFNIGSIRYPVPGTDRLEVELQFDGAVFEMEDQRNWTDASYKTYCTPLGLPFPVQLRKGESVRQAITVALHGDAAELRTLHSHRSLEAADTTHVQVTTDAAGRLPEIGFGHPNGLLEHDEKAAALLPLLKAKHIRVELKLQQDGWRSELKAAAEAAAAAGAALDIEALCGESGEGLEPLVNELAALPVPVSRLYPFPARSNDAKAALLHAARERLLSAGLTAIRLGAGTRAYFTQLNRAVNAPNAMADVIGYTINPQVHAFDNTTLIESLPVQALTARNAVRLTGAKPLCVGPVTLKPREQPGAAAALRPGELPPYVDERQPSLFCAAWTIGSIRELASAGVESVTYFETAGPGGLMSEQSVPYPVFRVFAELAVYSSDAELLTVHTNEPLRVQTLAIRSGSNVRIGIAQCTNEPLTIQLQLPDFTDGTIRYMDESTWKPEQETYHSEPECLARRDSQHIAITLKPFGLAWIDLTTPDIRIDW